MFPLTNLISRSDPGPKNRYRDGLRLCISPYYSGVSLTLANGSRLSIDECVTSIVLRTRRRKRIRNIPQLKVLDEKSTQAEESPKTQAVKLGGQESVMEGLGTH